MQKERFHTKRGFSLVEVMLASALFGIIVTAYIGVYIYGQESTLLSGHRVQATLLAREGIEAVHNIRDESFGLLVDGTYGLSTTTGEWDFSGSSDSVGIFTRAVAIGTIDGDRKVATATVSWQQNAQRDGVVTLVTRFTNWLATGLGDWSNPVRETGLDFAGNQNGIKVQVQGNYAYVVRNGGSPDFAVIDVSAPATPSVVGSLSLSGGPSNIFVSGDYAYVSTDSNTAEFQIIDISTPASPSVVGTFNNAGNQNATGVYVVGTTAYVTFDGSNELSIINVTVPALPVLLSTLNLASGANEIVVSGSHAYIASDSNTEELQVIDISNPLLPTQVASLDFATNSNADTIAIVGSVIVLGKSSDIYTIDISTPTSPSVLGTAGTSSIVNDIALNFGNGGTYAYLATSDNALEFQVIDISTPASPTLLGSLDIVGNNNINGVAYDETLDRAFIARDSNSEEFSVIAPQ